MNVDPMSCEKKIGYAFLHTKLHLPVFPPKVHAEISGAVTGIRQKEKLLLVPTRYQLSSDDVVGHVLFALKHEGINLPILAETMLRIDKARVLRSISKKPTGIYQRKLGYFWELFNNQELPFQIPDSCRYVNLFDERHYVTRKGRKCAKWRIRWNGLGSVRYCPVVQKTEKIQKALTESILRRYQEFFSQLGVRYQERIQQWAYFFEAQSSYDLEGENLKSSRIEQWAFVHEKAHEVKILTKESLCALYTQVNHIEGEQKNRYRKQQNWLSNGRRGALGVSYVPPSPEIIDVLMNAFLEMANDLPKQVHPVIAASVTSFGFVFLHPFMDGNGRLSRFLFHQQLCLSGQLRVGQLLPVSVAMKKSESQYLVALQSFSKPARALWSVQWVMDQDFDFHFNGSDVIYRYWDATQCVEFGLEMAENALNVYLRDEVIYLMRFDEIWRKVNERFDIRDSILHVLINGCLDLNGRVSKNHRKRYRLSVPANAMDYIEEVTQEVLQKELS